MTRPSKAGAAATQGVKTAKAKGPKAKKLAAAVPAGQVSGVSAPGAYAPARFLADGLIDVDAIVAELGITKATLAGSLGFSEETLHKFARVNAPKTQARLRDFLEIVARVEPWAGGWLQAYGWYRSTGIPALGDETAEAFVKRDEAAIVRAYLDAYAAGSYA